MPYPEVVLADRPLAYWRLGELSGPTALDSAGNHPGEYQEDQGAIGYGVPGLVRGGDRAIQLSGAQGVVVGDHFSFAEGQPFSLEAWIRADTLDDEIRVVLAKPYRSETGEQGYSLAVRQQAGVRFWFARDDTFARIQASYTEGQVAHVVATYDGAIGRVYVDGVLRGSMPITQPLPETPGMLVLGMSRQGVGFVGVLDEVAVYDIALSAERVVAHYEAGQP